MSEHAQCCHWVGVGGRFTARSELSVCDLGLEQLFAVLMMRGLTST